jgi:hypothetical protein
MPTQMGPIDQANLNHWTTAASSPPGITLQFLEHPVHTIVTTQYPDCFFTI